MYANPYGGGGPGGAGAGPGVPGNNGGTPQNSHMPPNQPQMMYNSQQQYPMSSQGHFSGANPSVMMAAAGPAGMMQNAGMPPHMAPNGQMGYQPPMTSSPYGGGMTSAAPQAQLAPSYGMPGSMPHQFQGNPAALMQHQQLMQQRMYPGQQNGPNMAMGTPQRQQQQFNPRQATPNHSTPTPQQQQQQQQHPSHQQQQQQQQSTHQHQQQRQQNQHQQHQGQYTPNQQGMSQGMAQNQTVNTMQQQQQQQPLSASTATPQTPTFPSTGGLGMNGTATNATPLSPGTELRNEERFSLLLTINQELLFETIQLQHTRSEIKKELSMAAEGGGSANNNTSELAEQEKMLQIDWAECMRRLQANLSYLASLADRKINQPQLPCPAYLSSPPFNHSIKLRPQPAQAGDVTEEVDPNEDRKERDQFLQGQYQKLQALFPGMDPKKEPFTVQQPNRPQHMMQQGQNGQNGQQRPMVPGPGQQQHANSNQGSPAQIQQQLNQRPPSMQTNYMPQGVGAS